MRVTVLGAGVIGMSCAYYLARAGHEVVVVDRQRGPALELSFANAGGICPGFAGLGRRRDCRSRRTLAVHDDAPVVLRPRLDPYQWRWLARFLRNCSAERFARNKARMQRIAHPQQGMPRRADCGHAHRLRPRPPAACCSSSAPRGACRGAIRARAPSSASRTA